MVRETRHLWVGNLPENISEERIKEHFKRYGPVQSVKMLPGGGVGGEEGGPGMCATVAFVDICAAAKAHKADNRLEDRCLKTTYHEASLSALSSPQYTPPIHLHREPPTHPYTPTPPPAPNPNNPVLAARSPRFSSG
ncbi:msx2-interacting protein-like [Homarus americanus]|uniref:msx2-interacting protein-like n=1 Tax=Homarus americanus TaxID=6706 RepID=UPI001C474392|nr:msx2-interacting protein-like [Homarus americanus]